MHILIADDNAQARSALRLLFEEMKLAFVTEGSEEMLQLRVSEAADAAELYAQIRKNPVDVVILDWELPGADPATWMRLLHEKRPACRVVALSTRPEGRPEAAGAGVHAFVGRSDPAEVLLKAVLGEGSRPSQ